jgi:mitochondrial-processing peptidase subunit alpha
VSLRFLGAQITPEALRGYARAFFTPKRMVISAVGVPHNEMVSIVQDAFAALPGEDGSVKAVKAKYTGGDVRQHKKLEAEDVHFALGFETGNAQPTFAALSIGSSLYLFLSLLLIRLASFHDKDLLAVCVLQQMMGGGGSFSTGGPGKGLYSRLYENMLNRHGQ